MEKKSSIVVFIDNEQQPVGEFESPVNFELDTRKLPDGPHQLRIVGKDTLGKEGLNIIDFTVRNGPAISVEGLKKNDVVDGVLNLMVNAYSKGNQKQFLIEGSESPKSIPSWLWAAILVFVAWAAYFSITSLIY
ncbi:cytochrome C [Pedobacter suwonensis]|uniref:cytochrome C n=1 Tax=Pedobacter suwonensis TaxID=332999 RepID=UPI00369CC1CF